MKYHIRWTRNASVELFEIINFIKNENRIVAQNIFHSIRKETVKLKLFPNKGRIVPELKNQHILLYRELFHKVWRIIYKIEKNNIFIIAVIDSRRDFDSIIMDEILRQ